ncbi:MAG: GFA family protein [Pseudomonadales bacterium]|nr:GFA family protein [Pseudomonadales bacterium]
MEGQCLCNAVTLTAKAVTEVDACHCTVCRRWGGAPMMTVHCGSDLGISGSDNISVFKSSEWAERAFCKHCGTHLFYHLLPANEYIVPVGLFQDQSDFTFTQQIFIDEKPAFYDFSNQTENLTGQQVFDKYASQ